MNERPMMEARLLMQMSDKGGYTLIPFQQAAPREQRDVQKGKWAEISLPYHPNDETEPIYGFLIFIVGKPQHELALLEVSILDAQKEHLYQNFRQYAVPFFDWDWETPVE
ncbi:MAG: hypothetical protein SF029_11170 [bacterium]|nr:hypothetical protein [bacterium]